MAFWAKKIGNHYEPLGEKANLQSLKIKEGDTVQIEHWKERNVKFHRKYFALLNCAIYHLPEDSRFDQYRDINYFRKYLLILIGKCDVIIGLSGKENYLPQSISFKSMDEKAFKEVYDRTLDIIVRYFLKDISITDFEQDIMNFYD